MNVSAKLEGAVLGAAVKQSSPMASSASFSKFLQSSTLQKEGRLAPSSTAVTASSQKPTVRSPEDRPEQRRPAEAVKAEVVSVPLTPAIQIPLPDAPFVGISTQSFISLDMSPKETAPSATNISSGKPSSTLESSALSQAGVSLNGMLPGFEAAPGSVVPATDGEGSQAANFKTMQAAAKSSDSSTPEARVNAGKLVGVNDISKPAAVAGETGSEAAAPKAGALQDTGAMTKDQAVAVKPTQMNDAALASVLQPVQQAKDADVKPVLSGSYDKALVANPTAKSASSRMTVSAGKNRTFAATEAHGKVKSEAANDSDQTQSSDKKTASVSFAAKMVEGVDAGAPHSTAHTEASGGTDAPTPTLANQSSAAISDKNVEGKHSTTGMPMPTATHGQPDAKPLNGLSSAQLVQSIHQSEMKLGMHSVEFGNISINTSLNHQAISAQISTEHPELSRALAVHISAIEEKLGSAYGVQARVEVRDGGGATGSHTQEQAEQQNSQRAGRVFGASASRAAGTMSAAAVSTVLPAAGSMRLDIRI